MLLGASLANMQDTNLNLDNTVSSSDKKSKIIDVPVTTERGQLLHENHCSACHNDSVNSRNNSKAHSVDEIRQWVVRWSKHLELGWGQHDVDLVTDFLNQRYYHFTTEK